MPGHYDYLPYMSLAFILLGALGLPLPIVAFRSRRERGRKVPK